MNKVLTVVIPSYNVEQYLKDTLDSFISDKIMPEIEILIVNDGSKDSTPAIAEEYVRQYPQTFRLINKENGGHGSTINRGIEEASGKYFKVVDGDDWVNTEDFAELVRRLRSTEADYVVTNYYKVNDRTKEKKLEDFPWFKENPVTTFREAAHQSEIPMHALVIRTEILQKNTIRLDEHCFYVDNEYITFPVPYVNTVQYFDLCVYMYRLAVATQSVSMKGFQKHLQDHVRVTLRLVDFAVEYEKTGGDKDKAVYLNNQAAIMVGDQAGIYASFPASDKEIRRQFEEFDAAVKEKSSTIYELSDSKSKMLHALRKSGFKRYWFWTTLSKLRMKVG